MVNTRRMLKGYMSVRFADGERIGKRVLKTLNGIWRKKMDKDEIERRCGKAQEFFEEAEDCMLKARTEMRLVEKSLANAKRFSKNDNKEKTLEFAQRAWHSLKAAEANGYSENFLNDDTCGDERVGLALRTMAYDLRNIIGRIEREKEQYWDKEKDG